MPNTVTVGGNTYELSTDGATSRSLANWITTVSDLVSGNVGIDVQNYIPDVTGITDHSSYVREAVAAAVASGENAIYFSPRATGYLFDYTGAIADSGGYATPSCVFIPSHFRVIGCGRAGRIKQTGTSTTPGEKEFGIFGFHENAAVEDILFEDLDCYGTNGAADGTGFTYVQNSATTIINGADGNYDITVRNCVFANLVGFSVHQNGSGKRWKVLNNRSHWTANGINVNGNYHQFIGNHFNNSEGFEVAGNANLIMGNTLIDCIDVAIAVGGDEGVTDPSFDYGTIICNNVIDGVTHTQGSGATGIIATDAMTLITIANNNISSCTGFGIDLEVANAGAFRVRKATITGNVIRACGNAMKVVGDHGASGSDDKNRFVVANNYMEHAAAGICLTVAGTGNVFTGNKIVCTAGNTSPVQLRDGTSLVWEDSNDIEMYSGAGNWTFDGTASVPNLKKLQAVTFSATPAFLTYKGAVARIILTNNITGWTLDNGSFEKQFMDLYFVQDGTGNWTLAGTPANVRLAGSALTLSTGASKIDTIRLKWDVTLSKWLEVSRSLNC